MTTRMIPPSTSAIGNGGTQDGVQRVYTGAAYYDMPDQDANLMQGWVSFGLSGPTSARPSPGGGWFYDTTLNETIRWLPDYPRLGNNGHWVNAVGAQV